MEHNYRQNNVKEIIAENKEKLQGYNEKMRELDEKNKQLDFRTAYKNTSGTNSNRVKGNDASLKTIPEGDNENFSKKYTEEDERSFNNQSQSMIKDRNVIQSSNNKGNSGNNSGYNNYSQGHNDYNKVHNNYDKQSPKHYNDEYYKNQSNHKVDTSNNLKETELVYSSDEDANAHELEKKYQHIPKKYSEINHRESKLSDLNSKDNSANISESSPQKNKPTKLTKHKQNYNDIASDEDEDIKINPKQHSIDKVKLSVGDMRESVDTASIQNPQSDYSPSPSPNKDKMKAKNYDSDDEEVGKYRSKFDEIKNNYNKKETRSKPKSATKTYANYNINRMASPKARYTTNNKAELSPDRQSEVDIEEKKHHTAYTYASIAKMKSFNNESKKTTTIFKDNVLNNKTYKGKTDRLAVYNYLRSEWKKTPILKKKPNMNQTPYSGAFIYEEISPQEKQKIESDKLNRVQRQKISNISKPLSYYRKF